MLATSPRRSTQTSSSGSHVELVIASTGELSGTVRFEDGTTPERFTISIVDKPQVISVDDSFFRTNGVWRLTEIPAGNYEISASATEGSVKLEQALTLGEGEVRDGIELVLSSRITVRGRIVDLETREPVAGMSVHVSGSSGRRSDNERRHVSDADGRFELENVPIGDVTLSASSYTSGSKGKYERLWQPLSIAAQPQVQDIGEVEIVTTRLEPNQEPGDLGFYINDWDPSIKPEDWQAVVASVRPDGPAAATGLTDGDVIEKVDGNEISGLHSSRYRSLTQVPAGTTVKLELASGKTIGIIAAKPI